MVISDKQQEANRQNAQHSTGPNTPEGKAAVRLNALKYGLRARDLIIFDEDPEEYKQLWSDLEAEWQPQNRTERLQVEQMSTSQWLLARTARGESRIYQADIPIERQFALLDRVAAQRTRLERSYSAAMRQLEHIQQKRQAQPQPVQTPQPTAAPFQTPAGASAPPPDYPMSDGMSKGTEDHPVFCSPASPDSR
jgi:hypothetical protein